MIVKRLTIAAAFAFTATSALAVTDAKVERIDAHTVTVSWHDARPVSVYVVRSATAGIARTRPVLRNVRTGTATLPSDGNARRYLLLRTPDGRITRVAERLVPLAQGSNFRDIGGYEGAGGKHVRWGMIYRSGASPLLSADDLSRIKALGLRNMIDLRSSEERAMAPTRIVGVRYAAVDYSMMKMMGDRRAMTNGVDLYRNFPSFFAPQLKIIFDDLIRKRGPLVYNCSAGQDRTGFTTAMILSALGVPRGTIVSDYHLSTAYRQPQYELPPIDEATAKSNPVAGMFAAYQKSGATTKAQPLKDASGKPFLDGAFEEIDTKWGSVDTYLEKEVGVTKGDLALLRATYLE